MTYQVLARKWRPRDFASLVGQEHVVRALTHALDQQRLHHAYLFTGTRGVGKTTLSRILAKALNCETGITSQPCGVCRACREIDAGRFIDYVEMDAASNRGVDEMAALLERAVYSPVDARFKVYMIDEVHMLTNHAFNAMLKTLEEPPAHVKFILATTDPQKIPVTVLSRCLQFNLKQMPAGDIVTHLDKVLSAENIGFEPQALRLLSRAADGSMRDALSLTDQAIAYAVGVVSEEAVRGMLGALDQNYLIRLLDGIVTTDGAAVLAIADEMAARSLSFSVALQDLAQLLNRIGWAQFAPASVLEEWPEAADIRRFAASLSPEHVQLYYQIATIGRSDLGLAPDEYAGFTMALLRMLAFQPFAHTTPSGTVPPSPASVRPATAPAQKHPATASSTGSAVKASNAPVAARLPDAASLTLPQTLSRDVNAVNGVNGINGGSPSADRPFSDAQTHQSSVDSSERARALNGHAAANHATGHVTPPWESEKAPAASEARSAPPPTMLSPGQSAAAVIRDGADERPRGAQAGSAAPNTDIPTSRRSTVTDDDAASSAPARRQSPARAALDALGVRRSTTSVPAPAGRPMPRPASSAIAPSAAPGAGRPAGRPASYPAEGRSDFASGSPAASSGSVARNAATAQDDGYDASGWDGAPWEDDGADAFLSSARPAGRPDAARGDRQASNNAASASNAASSANAGTSTGASAAANVGANAVAFSPRPPVNVALAPAVPLDALGFDQDWPSLAAVLDIKGLAQQLAYQSELIAADAQSMTLRIPVAQLAAGPHVEKVIAAVVERLGRPVDIRIEIGSASRTAAAVDAARKAEQQWHAEQSIQSDPFVQALLRDFDAAILPGSTQPLAKQITQ